MAKRAQSSSCDMASSSSPILDTCVECSTKLYIDASSVKTEDPLQQLAPTHRIPDADYPDQADARRWLEAGAWLRLTIGGAVERAAQERGAATAVADPTGRLSYRDLDVRSHAVAQALLARGLEAGDRVLVQVGIGAAAVVALMGIVRAGLVPVCAVPRYRDYEMANLASVSRARAHLVEPGSAGSFDLVADRKSVV